MSQLSLSMPVQKRNRRYEHHRTYETIRFLRSRGYAVYRQGRFHYVKRLPCKRGPHDLPMEAAPLRPPHQGQGRDLQGAEGDLPTGLGEEEVSKHTPGPWCVRPYGEVTDDWDESICMVLLRPGGEANARLISAAPELLDALEGVLRVADRKTVEFDAARAAIAKARG